jgi:lipopolysaccharide/colanic/teichoic acid biosynthesis glycosyltransferase
MVGKGTAQGIPRGFEIAIAALGLVIVAPVLFVFGVLIKTDSQGPVLFRQKRIGRYGKAFTLLKLRTMSAVHEGPLVTAAGDSRVTSVGKILRKTKIDELPALWNVLRGDMCFVGPRPEVPEYVNLEDPKWQEVLESRPGITDPVTLRLRNEEELLAEIGDRERFYREILQPYKLHCYLRFARERSWKTDIRIIGRTLKATLLPRSVAPPTREEMGWAVLDS